mgnify:CR=1 FL=1
MPHLKADDVSYSVRGVPLVSNVTIDVSGGEIVTVLGPNGAGKSTLLRMLSGEIAPSAGRVSIGGRDMGGLRAAELARLRVVVAQASALNFPFTVYEVVRLGVSVPGLLRENPLIDQAVSDAISKVGLSAYAGRLYTQLSGGERQRTHIARALCQLAVARRSAGGGLVLLLDEPTSSLDIGHQRIVLDAVRREAEHGVAILTVMHDLNLAAAFADRVLIMTRGRLVAAGPPRETMTSAVLGEAYECDVSVSLVQDTPFVLPEARRSISTAARRDGTER